MKTYEKMSQEQLAEKAPAIYATRPASKVSGRYSFMPTSKLVDRMESMGWFPVKAEQQQSRKESTADVGKHAVWFRREEDIHTLTVGEYVLEAHFLNSHDTTLKLDGGITVRRCFCDNQCTAVMQDMLNIKIKHIGMTQSEVKKVIKKILANFETVSKRIEEYRSIILTPEEKIEIAKKAITIRWGEEAPAIAPETLLEIQRHQDQSNDLWTVFNVVQEHVIKGGDTYRNENNRRRHVRAVRGLMADQQINKELWMVMEAVRVSRTARNAR